MYLPQQYNIQDTEKAITLIENNSFGDLVTFHDGNLCSNKVPFFYDKKENLLYGHFGKTNPQLNQIQEEAPKEVLVIFTGAHAYISPQWYKSENGVPTWNFQTVQVKGLAKTVDDNGLIKILNKLSAFHESQFDTPWSMDRVSPDKLKKMLSMIVGFEIDITEIKFKEKMSQNRDEKDRLSVIKGLRGQGSQGAENVAGIMNYQTFQDN